jgi:hypothetical protein
MRESYFRFFRNEPLQRRYRGFEVIGIDISLRFVEQIVQCIRHLLLLGVRPLFRYGSSRR